MWAVVGTQTVILSGLMMVCKILCRLAIAVDDRENPGGFYRPRLKLSWKGSGFRVQAQQS